MYMAVTIEQAGTGTEEIVKKCLAYGLRQPEFIQEDGFTTVVWRKEASDVKEVMEDGGLNGTLNCTLNGTLNGTLNEPQSKVLLFISENEGINATAIIEKLSIPRDTLNKIIRHLMELKLIERRGSKKTGGYWKVIN